MVVAREDSVYAASTVKMKLIGRKYGYAVWTPEMFREGKWAKTRPSLRGWDFRLLAHRIVHKASFVIAS